MRVKFEKKILSWLLCMMLIVAMAFTMIGCDANNGASETLAQTEDVDKEKITVVGEGQTKFMFVVIDKDNNETYFEVHTDKKTVGEALIDLKLIEGEDSQYGLFVKKVNGITADYDVDKTYWAFYVNGEYAMSGVDATDITPGSTYSFKVEK